MTTRLSGRYVPPPVSDGYVLKTSGGDVVWVPPSEAFDQYATFADLPDASTNVGVIAYVVNGSGVWLINRKQRGFYRSNGIAWEYAGELIEAFSSDNFQVYDSNNSNRSFKFSTSQITSSSPIIVTIPDRDVTIGETAEYTSRTVTCDTTVIVGDWVYLDSGIALKALATDATAVSTFGVVISKPASTTAVVATSGTITGIFTTLTSQKEYFLSETTAGAQVVAGPGIPSSAGAVLLVVGLALSSNQMLIKIELRGRRS